MTTYTNGVFIGKVGRTTNAALSGAPVASSQMKAGRLYPAAITGGAVYRAEQGLGYSIPGWIGSWSVPGIVLAFDGMNTFPRADAKVTAYDLRTSKVLGVAYSGSDGSFEIKFLDAAGTIKLIAEDKTGFYSPAIDALVYGDTPNLVLNRPILPTFSMRAWDGTQWVRWLTSDPSATPSATTPAAVGALTRKTTIATWQ
jgi:hypothetical protein